MSEVDGLSDPSDTLAPDDLARTIARERPDLSTDMVAYLVDLTLRGRHLTARTVGDNLEQFARWARTRNIAPVLATPMDLSAFLHDLSVEHRTPQGRPLARTTVGTRIANLKGWYRWCRARQRIPSDPSQHLRVHVPRSRVVVRDPLALQEITALLQTQAAIVRATVPGTHTRAEAWRNLAALSVGFATGRRIGGMGSLRVTDLDALHGELRVEREKGISGRVLAVKQWAVTAATRYLAEARPLLTRGHATPWLFLNALGNGPITRDALRWLLAQVVARTITENPDLTDLPAKRISWHSLRVSYATLMFHNGCDIRSVSELLLHRQLSTTSRYAVSSTAERRDAIRVAHLRP